MMKEPATPLTMTPGARDMTEVFLATRGVSTLRTICVVWLLTIVATNTQHYLSHGELATPWVTPVSIAFIGSIFWLLQVRRVRAAVAFFLWGSAVLMALTAPTVAGLNSPILVALPVVGTLSSWLLGPRHGVMVLVLSVFYLAALGVGQSHGLTATQTRDPALWAMAYAFFCLLGTVFGIAMARSVREQYDTAVALGNELREANSRLEDKVAERTAELTAALERLKQTQDDLIQAEKLASLGSMVAGVAHELNTPIGNTLTVSSTMSDHLGELKAMIQGPSMRRADLTGAVDRLADMSALVERSCKRAAGLVANFKQVAIDQVSERRRAFNLREVVEEDLAALRPSFKAQPWVIENNVPAGIDCDSFPGPLGQVLTNLIQNAILHGFAGREHGAIRIEAREDGPLVELTVTDDGAGMDSATALRVFDPFFTTRLGQGGSGLGLAICYRIVTTLLSGEIRVVSSPESGSQFNIRIPKCAPGKL